MQLKKEDYAKLQVLLQLNGYQEYLAFNYEKRNELHLYEKCLSR